jgi:ABC-2 type transport system permease protein
MLASVFTKSISDRWTSMAVATVSIGLLLIGAAAVYKGIDLSIYQDMPEALKNLYGFSSEGGVSQLAYGAIYSFMAALAYAGVAVSIGTSSIAGEERDGTMGILLGNPRSRGYVLAHKTAGLICLVALGGLVLLGAGLLAPGIVGISTAGTHIDALMLHMFANALVFGLLALAVGGWTGNPSLSSGTAAGLMVVSYLAVSLLPMVSGLADLAKIFPWYYYNGSDPLRNGVDGAHLAVQLGLSALFIAIAAVGFQRRDLRERTVGTSLLDRLRDNPLTHRAMEKLAGTARVSGVVTKTASEQQGMLAVISVAIVLLGILIGLMFNGLQADLATISEDLPEGVMALVGNVDMGTPEGWLTGELYSLVVPIALIALAATMGSRALGSEEKTGTMGLLLARPISRSRIVLGKSAAMLINVGIAVVLTSIGVALGSWLGDLGVGTTEILATSLMAGLLASVFGALAFALGAATGRVPLAAFGSAGAAFVAYLANSMLPLSDNLSDFAKLSPFYYYLTGDPLVNGIDWSHALVLGGLTAGLIALSLVLFNRRDLR